ncbi:hypothetical protein GCM10008955_41690 [Deinococcus malanensis]|uniref:YtxH domain-containing protein n=1 Tax=Deinococcus malanensis TaxID=1706855 RepID=A0ABQ2F5R6_9DEIO|nr:DUF6110 family protein [Deinococcus malanensis]GGK43596.1 hypothetical protein GCM10008955_41690 [Deinococcus malanensis]
MSDHEKKVKVEVPEIKVIAPNGGNDGAAYSGGAGQRQRAPQLQMAPTTRSFLGGLLVGTVGLKLLGSRDAKRLYAHLIAEGMKIKDTLDTSVEGVRASYDDVMADARSIYEKDRSEQKRREYADLSGDGENNAPDLVDAELVEESAMQPKKTAPISNKEGAGDTSSQ